MTISAFRDYALRSLLEAYLWKPLEADEFELSGVKYRLTMEPTENFSLCTWNGTRNKWNEPKIYPDMARLFSHLFHVHGISR